MDCSDGVRWLVAGEFMDLWTNGILDFTGSSGMRLGRWKVDAKQEGGRNGSTGNIASNKGKSGVSNL